MFLVILIGSIIASLFTLCGLIGGVVFFLHAEQGMDIKVFLSDFIMATWPLLAGCLLFALMEILKELRALRLATEAHSAAEPTAKKADPTKKAAASEPRPKQPSAPAEKEAPVYFPVRETPQGPRIIHPIASEAQAAEPTDKQDSDSLTFFKTR